MIEEQNLPLVSVIVPCYNHEKYVEQTIESIVNQTYKNIELIVIDDGSKDNSPIILEELSKKYNFYYEHQQNIGLPATLNKMIKMSKGKYISTIASDDICTLDRVELLINEFEQLPNSYAVVCGDAKFINDKGEEVCDNQYCRFLEYYTSMRTDFNYKINFGTYETLLIKNYIPAMSTLIKKESLLSVGLYEENISIEDWNMWLKLTKKHKIKYINKVVAYYRWHDNNSIKIITNKLKIDELKVLEREEAYCYSHGFTKIWEQKYYGGILNFFLLKKYAIFYQCLNRYNIFNFSIFFLKKIINRILFKYKNIMDIT